MKKIISIDIEKYTIDNSKNFSIRNTARAIIFNNENQIAFINAEKYKYHVIPGGGIDEGETQEEALKRECLEETGLNIKIIQEIGLTEEIQRYSHKIQNSFCYIAEVVGEAIEPKLEENELRAGYILEWVMLDEAISILKKEGFTNTPGEYAFLRNIAIFNEARNILKK